MSLFRDTDGRLVYTGETKDQTWERLGPNNYPCKSCQRLGCIKGSIYTHLNAENDEEYNAKCRECSCERREDMTCEDYGVNKCHYCGSMPVEDAIAFLATPGIHYSGADWKYGFPHKFYIGDGKFYSKHMMQASDEQLERFNKVAASTINVLFGRDERGTYWDAPRTNSFYGYQAAGKVGGDRQEFY